MELFIAKEKFASLKGYENFEDYKQMVGQAGKNGLTDAKIREAFELVKTNSRY